MSEWVIWSLFAAMVCLLIVAFIGGDPCDGNGTATRLPNGIHACV